MLVSAENEKFRIEPLRSAENHNTDMTSKHEAHKSKAPIKVDDKEVEKKAYIMNIMVSLDLLPKEDFPFWPIFVFCSMIYTTKFKAKNH